MNKKLTLLFLFISGLFFSQDLQNAKSWDDEFVSEYNSKEKLYEFSNLFFTKFKKESGKEINCENSNEFQLFLDELIIKDSLRNKKKYAEIKLDIKTLLYDTALIKDEVERKSKIQLLLDKYNLQENEKFYFSDINEENCLNKISKIEDFYILIESAMNSNVQTWTTFTSARASQMCIDEILNKYMDSKSCFDDLKMVSEKTNVNYYLQYKKLTDKNEKKKFLENFFEIFEKTK